MVILIVLSFELCLDLLLISVHGNGLHRYSTRADIWSAGSTLFELADGGVLFIATRMFEVMLFFDVLYLSNMEVVHHGASFIDSVLVETLGLRNDHKWPMVDELDKNPRFWDTSMSWDDSSLDRVELREWCPCFVDVFPVQLLPIMFWTRCNRVELHRSVAVFLWSRRLSFG